MMNLKKRKNTSNYALPQYFKTFAVKARAFVPVDTVLLCACDAGAQTRPQWYHDYIMLQKYLPLNVRLYI